MGHVGPGGNEDPVQQGLREDQGAGDGDKVLAVSAGLGRDADTNGVAAPLCLH